jgi:hypothetical protein
VKAPERQVINSLVAMLDASRIEATAARMLHKASVKALLDIHDAPHRECDADVDLPKEIRTLRAEREAARMDQTKLTEALREVVELLGHEQAWGPDTIGVSGDPAHALAVARAALGIGRKAGT